MRRKNKDLTNAEKEVLHLLADEFLTIKQIQIRRGCSFQAVYKILKKIKEKGFLDNSLNRIDKCECSNPNDIRLHGQEFNIKLISQQPKYQSLLKKSNILFLDGNTIKLYRNSIEVYSGNSFIGKNENIAERKSFEYFNGFFARLEHELGVIILKPRYRNIRLVNQHYARGDSDICENAIKNKEKVKVVGKDGIVWWITDDSFGFKEDETIHPIEAKHDRGKIDKYANDFRNNLPPTNSELAKFQAETSQNLNILTKVMSDYGSHIKSHTEAIKTLSKAIPQLTKLLKDTMTENKQLKQRRLGDFF